MKNCLMFFSILFLVNCYKASGQSGVNISPSLFYKTINETDTIVFTYTFNIKNDSNIMAVWPLSCIGGCGFRHLELKSNEDSSLILVREPITELKENSFKYPFCPNYYGQRSEEPNQKVQLFEIPPGHTATTQFIFKYTYKKENLDSLLNNLGSCDIAIQIFWDSINEVDFIYSSKRDKLMEDGRCSNIFYRCIYINNVCNYYKLEKNFEYFKEIFTSGYAGRPY